MSATERLLYAPLRPGETTVAAMSALRAVFQTHGLPIAFYTDRAGWAIYTPSAGGKVDRRPGPDPPAGRRTGRRSLVKTRRTLHLPNNRTWRAAACSIPGRGAWSRRVHAARRLPRKHAK